MHSDAEKAADRGFAYFSEREGDGWYRRINWNILDMGKGSLCITGQASGIYHFPLARKHYGLNAIQAINLGLLAPPLPSWEDVREYYHQLGEAWRALAEAAMIRDNNSIIIEEFTLAV